jgi:glycosyltransferase involved in cell wall biosynthesis
MAYVGSLGGWYLTDEMIRLFCIARAIDPDLHFLILTQTPTEAEAALSRSGVDARAFSVATVHPREVPACLLAADFGISFIKPAPSKVSSSPTKVGEYLASGLPVLANRGVGDVDAIIERHHVGVLIEDFSDRSYREAAASMFALVAQDSEVKRRCRRAAEEELSLERVGVPRYLAVYRRLGLGNRSGGPNSAETARS